MALFDAGFFTQVGINHRVPLDLGRNNSRGNREVVQALANLLSGQGVGTIDALTLNANQGTIGSNAGATLVLSGGSSAVGGIINGVTVTATFASSDINTQGLVAAAINASVNALVQGFVRASNVAGSLTLASVVAGTRVNIRVGSSTYEFTATSAATGRLGDFDISGNDTADALALANAINVYPALNQSIRAESVAGVCHVYALDGSATGKVMTVSAATITVAAFAASARCHVAAIIPGGHGNAITIALSGTGMTVANSNARLVGGAGGLTGTIKYVNAGGAT